MGNPHGGLIIKTDRLMLHPLAIDHFEHLCALFASPETFRFPPRPPLDREDAWGRLLRHVGHWSAHGYGLFAVTERASGRFVGETGLARFKRETAPQSDDRAEAAWTIAPGAQGRGYATEAAGAALDWASRELGLNRPACMIHPDNLPSIRVAGKLGFSEVARVIHKEHPAIILERMHAGGPPQTRSL